MYYEEEGNENSSKIYNSKIMNNRYHNDEQDDQEEGDESQGEIDGENGTYLEEQKGYDEFESIEKREENLFAKMDNNNYYRTNFDFEQMDSNAIPLEKKNAFQENNNKNFERNWIQEFYFSENTDTAQGYYENISKVGTQVKKKKKILDFFSFLAVC